MADDGYNRVVLGTELKLNINIEPMGGLHMGDYDFVCNFYTSSNGMTLTIPKSEMIKVDEDNFIARVDTTSLSTGVLQLKLTAYLPDEDMGDGLRTEIVRIKTTEKIVS